MVNKAKGRDGPAPERESRAGLIRQVPPLFLSPPGQPQPGSRVTALYRDERRQRRRATTASRCLIRRAACPLSRDSSRLRPARAAHSHPSLIPAVVGSSPLPVHRLSRPRDQTPTMDGDRPSRPSRARERLPRTAKCLPTRTVQQSLRPSLPRRRPRRQQHLSRWRRSPFLRTRPRLAALALQITQPRAHTTCAFTSSSRCTDRSSVSTSLA
jgi:hypothetical protein